MLSVGGDNIFGKMSRGKVFLPPKSGEIPENPSGNFAVKCNLPTVFLPVSAKYPQGVSWKFWESPKNPEILENFDKILEKKKILEILENFFQIFHKM
jgi:hypothetical protein